jgi:hypothetical protein
LHAGVHVGALTCCVHPRGVCLDTPVPIRIGRPRLPAGACERG